MDGKSGLPAKVEPEEHHLSPRFEHHFAEAENSYRYLGSESCLLKSPRLHANVLRPIKCDEDDDEWQLVMKDSPAKKYELVELYLQTIQPVFPVLDLTSQYLYQDVSIHSTDAELFALNMIYSISCHIMPNTGKKHKEQTWNATGRLSYHHANSLKYRVLATTYFNQAMEYLEAATPEPNIVTLRSVLLLAINSCFDPKTGNIGQQVALAGRIAFDLESKKQLKELEPKDAEMLRAMHMTIFTLENQVASTLDRPASFPEPVSHFAFTHWLRL